MMWRAYLLRPMTGEVGMQIPIADEGDWDIALNDIEEAKVSLKKANLSEMDRGWWSPWEGGIVLTAESAFCPETPIVAGPITSPPEESREYATFSVAGIRAFFLKRSLTPGDFRPGEEHELASSKLSFKGMSLGTIAWEVVKSGMDKMAGALPIVHASPSEVRSGLNERTYEGFNLANNNVDKRLSELSDVINGPDIMFRPRWKDDSHSRIVWDMKHGTAAQTAIDQDWEMVLDTTSEKSPVTDVSVKTNAEHMANRVYWTGAGEGAGTAIAIAQDLRLFGTYTPLLEIVGSDNDSENTSLISAKARAALSVGQQPLVQITLVINVESVNAPLGRWFVGDSARVKLKGWLTIPDGTYDMRIIAAKGGIGSQYATVEFQEDVL